MLAVLKWIVVNGMFATCLVAGTIYDVSVARNVSIFFIWVLLFCALGMCSDKVRKQLVEKKNWPSVPVWLDTIYDIAVLFLLAWYGWFVTVAAYFIQTMLLHATIAEVTKMRAEAKKENQ